MVIRGWPRRTKTDRAGDVVGMGWFGLVVSVGGGCGCIVVTVEGVMRGGWVVGGGVGEGGEGPCEYVGKRGRTPMNDVFVEKEIDS